MKTKIVVATIALVTILMSTGLVYAEPGPAEAPPLTPLEALTPIRPDQAQTAAAVITPTQQLNLVKTAKQGATNQHTGQAESAAKGAPGRYTAKPTPPRPSRLSILSNFKTRPYRPTKAR